jgi:hypothetical protein
MQCVCQMEGMRYQILTSFASRKPVLGDILVRPATRSPRAREAYVFKKLGKVLRTVNGDNIETEKDVDALQKKHVVDGDHFLVQALVTVPGVEHKLIVILIPDRRLKSTGIIRLRFVLIH